MNPATAISLASAAAQGANALFGGSSGPEKLPTLSRQQKLQQRTMQKSLRPEGQLGSAYGGALDLLKQYINPESPMFKSLAAPHMRQFQEQTIPGLAEQFAGMGAMGGGLSSSGFGQSLGAAGAGLQERLAALQAQIQQQAVQGILGQYNQQAGLTQGTPEFAYTNQADNPISSALGGFAQGGGFDRLGGLFGNKTGGATGGGIPGFGSGGAPTSSGAGISFGGAGSSGYSPQSFSPADFGTPKF